MFFNKSIKQLFTVFLLLFIILPVYGFSNSYKNNLLALDIKNNGNDSLNLTIFSAKKFFTKPASIKKGQGEYVILLPETFHSITSRPDVSKTNGLITSVDVKLLPYVGSNINNGYTKIVLKTTAGNLKINIKNQVVQQNSDSQLQQILSSNKIQTNPVLKEKKTIVTGQVYLKLPRHAELATTMLAKNEPYIDGVPSGISASHNCEIPKQVRDDIRPSTKKIQPSEKQEQQPKIVTVAQKHSKILADNNNLGNKKVFYIILCSILFPLILLLSLLKAVSFITGKNKNQQPDKTKMIERLHLMKNETTSSNEENDNLNFFENSQNEDFASVFASSKADDNDPPQENYVNNITNSSGGFILPEANDSLSEANDSLPEANDSEEKIDEQDFFEEDFDDIITDTTILDNLNNDISLNEAEEEVFASEISLDDEDDDFSDIFEEAPEKIEESEIEDEPTVWAEKEIVKDKTLYLVELNGEFSLIAMVNEQISVLYRFDEEPANKTLNFKLNETKPSEKIYIVQIDKWRALLGVSADKIRYILTL